MYEFVTVVNPAKRIRRARNAAKAKGKASKVRKARKSTPRTLSGMIAKRRKAKQVTTLLKAKAKGKLRKGLKVIRPRFLYDENSNQIYRSDMRRYAINPRHRFHRRRRNPARSAGRASISFTDLLKKGAIVLGGVAAAEYGVNKIPFLNTRTGWQRTAAKAAIPGVLAFAIRKTRYRSAFMPLVYAALGVVALDLVRNYGGFTGVLGMGDLGYEDGLNDLVTLNGMGDLVNENPALGDGGINTPGDDMDSLGFGMPTMPGMSDAY